MGTDGCRTVRVKPTLHNQAAFNFLAAELNEPAGPPPPGPSNYRRGSSTLGSAGRAAWEPTPRLGSARPAWHCDKCVLNCSEAALSPKLMIIIALHEKSILQRRARGGREGGGGGESLHHVCQQGERSVSLCVCVCESAGNSFIHSLTDLVNEWVGGRCRCSCRFFFFLFFSLVTAALSCASSQPTGNLPTNSTPEEEKTNASSRAPDLLLRENDSLVESVLIPF